MGLAVKVNFGFDHILSITMLSFELSKKVIEILVNCDKRRYMPELKWLVNIWPKLAKSAEVQHVFEIWRQNRSTVGRLVRLHQSRPKFGFKQ